MYSDSIFEKVSSSLKSYEIFKTAISLNDKVFKYINAHQSKYKHNYMQKRKRKDKTQRLNTILFKIPIS